MEKQKSTQINVTGVGFAQTFVLLGQLKRRANNGY
jgi:hypothetical protein